MRRNRKRDLDILNWDYTTDRRSESAVTGSHRPDRRPNSKDIAGQRGSNYVLSSRFAEEKGIPGIRMRSRPVDSAVSSAKAHLTPKTRSLRLRSETW